MSSNIDASMNDIQILFYLGLKMLLISIYIYMYNIHMYSILTYIHVSIILILLYICKAVFKIFVNPPPPVFLCILEFHIKCVLLLLRDDSGYILIVSCELSLKSEAIPYMRWR